MAICLGCVLFPKLIFLTDCARKWLFVSTIISVGTALEQNGAGLDWTGSAYVSGSAYISRHLVVR